jgi:hypothetical protein
MKRRCMTVKFVSSQDVDRFVSTAFIKRTVNCATSTNSGMENSSTCYNAVMNRKSEDDMH